MLILFIVVLGMAAGFLAQLLLRRDAANRAEALVAGLVGSESKPARGRSR